MLKTSLVGASAGVALAGGANNVAIGYEALSTEDGHGESTAVGYKALKTQNAGASGLNTAIGYQAGLQLPQVYKIHSLVLLQEIT